MELLASLVLAIHLLWILWVINGAFWTRGRPLLTVSPKSNSRPGTLNEQKNLRRTPLGGESETRVESIGKASYYYYD
jgi:hypothetical protein